MHSTELENLCTGLECFLERWNDFDRVGVPFYRVGIPLYRVGTLSTELERFRQSWNTFVQCLNAF
jgi:HAMP domain-containing protein